MNTPHTVSPAESEAPSSHASLCCSCHTPPRWLNSLGFVKSREAR